MMWCLVLPAGSDLLQWNSMSDNTSASLSHNLYFATDCSFCAAAAHVRNPWIGGYHGFLGHMRGFPIARSSRRCLDQKSTAIFIQEKERIRCGRLADWLTDWLTWGVARLYTRLSLFPSGGGGGELFLSLFVCVCVWEREIFCRIRSKPVLSTSKDWKQEWV